MRVRFEEMGNQGGEASALHRGLNIEGIWKTKILTKMAEVIPFLLQDRSYSFFGAVLCRLSTSLTRKSFKLNIFILATHGRPLHVPHEPRIP